ncbi:MAG: VOC family protein [Acidimicrobiia bacterium]|nr:VOC family protein [Acidimicrobiia bacterium]
MPDPSDDVSTDDERQFGDVGTRCLIDNDQVRVWELRLDPGASSDLHHHTHDYVMVQVDGDRIAADFEPDSGGTFAGATQLDGAVEPGAAIYARAGGKERAVNIGQQAFHEVIVEVKAPRRPGVRAVQHVSFNVVDFEAALPFYTDVLGLMAVPRPDFGFPGAWLDTGNGVQIHLIEDPSFVAPSGPHLAFETDDIAAEVARLRELGIEVTDPFELNGMRQAFFHDPSGNQFELNQPPRP